MNDNTRNKKYLKENFFLTFGYKSSCYSIQKRRSLFRTVYCLIDTDMPPQQFNSLESLFEQAHLHDGTILSEVGNCIEIPKLEDPFWLSYNTIRHNVIIYNNEIYFLYKERYYWIAHTDNGLSHLSDDLYNTQEFNSSRDLFDYARIDNKSLKEIWDEVVVYSC